MRFVKNMASLDNSTNSIFNGQHDTYSLGAKPSEITAAFYNIVWHLV